MRKLKNMFAKLKKIKNIELYLALCLLLIVLVSAFGKDDGSKKVENDLASQSYIEQMENKLITVLGSIDGCGEVSVAISYATDGKKVYAYESTTKKDGDTLLETSSIITVKGEPLLVQTLTPQILGVVIVADGASDPLVRYKIKQAVVTLLDIDVCCVQVFS